MLYCVSRFRAYYRRRFLAEPFFLNKQLRLENGYTLFYLLIVRKCLKKLELKMNTIHIGQEIEAVFNKTEHSISWFAKKLNFDRSNVYNIFKRKSIDTDLLFEISEILDFDFFILYKPKV